MTDGTLSSLILTGPPAPTTVAPLEEIIRPAAVRDRGVSFLDGATRDRLAYSDLVQRAATVGARLGRSGVRPGASVALTITNDIPSVLSVLGIWMAGASVVSVPPPPRRVAGWYGRQFGRVLEQMGCAVLLEAEATDGELLPDAPVRRIPIPALTAPDDGRPAHVDVEIPATALVQFTSGSIGAPKGVAVSRSALAGHLAMIISELQLDGETDRIASWLPLYHDMGLVVMFLGALAARAEMALAQPSSFVAQPSSWLTMLHAEQATITAAPDFGFRLAAAVPYAGTLDLSRLRVAVCGGERVSWPTLQAFARATETMDLPWGAIMPSYGLAESTVATSHTPLGRGPLLGPDGHVSTGRLMPGLQVRAPDGSVPGPLELRGSSMLSGYHTENGFDPVGPGEWFDTGDDGFVHEGELYVLGRRAEVVNVGGRNVFAEDIESVIYQACGQPVQVCAAFRSPSQDDRFGLIVEANPRAIRDRDAAGDLARVIQATVADALRTRLSPVVVTRLGSIPKTTSGKVQRARCRAAYDSGEFGLKVLAELG